jgi:hypothetical protein
VRGKAFLLGVKDCHEHSMDWWHSGCWKVVGVKTRRVLERVGGPTGWTGRVGITLHKMSEYVIHVANQRHQEPCLTISLNLAICNVIHYRADHTTELITPNT